MRTFVAILFCLIGVQGIPQSKGGYNPPFTELETLEYLLHYGFVNGGHAKLKIIKSTLNGIPAYHATANARTIGVADKLYRVRDTYESYMDVNTGLPLKTIRNISEGKYKYYNENVFYHDSNLVVSQKSGRIKVPDDIIDMVSALYHLRDVNPDKLSVGDTIHYVTYFADEIYPLTVRYRGKEKLKTKLGKFNCYVFAPVTEPGRVFKTEDDMLMWMSSDGNFIPLRIRFDMWVGSLKIDLIKYSGLRFPLK